MSEQVGEHAGADPGINLARGVRVTQHMAAEVRCFDPGHPGMLDQDMAYRG